ncbi:MAG: LPS export ABC transporter periplasmic protein LptC [Methylacidiphilales bacterium]|nr:LPS export ABC transporter periplasmic protein LptC [Candidatus Methylacidiphilales bacterium]
MRLLLLSVGTCILVLGAVWAQNPGDNANAPQLPVGQVFKQFEFPVWQDGKLKATFDAVEARGITVNRAETTDLRIQLYDNGVATTTITSPKADLYVTDQKMRTKYTVQIERADMEATSQVCDFDLKTKQYLMRTNVKVTLKHFDLSGTPAGGAATPTATTPAPTPGNASQANSPGAQADTHSAPISPAPPETK